MDARVVAVGIVVEPQIGLTLIIKVHQIRRTTIDHFSVQKLEFIFVANMNLGYKKCNQYDIILVAFITTKII